MPEVRINTRMDNTTFLLLTIGLVVISLLGTLKTLALASTIYVIAILLTSPPLDNYLIKKTIVGVLSLNNAFVGGTVIVQSEMNEIFKFIVFTCFEIFMCMTTTVILISIIFRNLDREEDETEDWY